MGSVGRGTAWGIRQTKAIGFDTIDIFADPLDTDARERKLIRTECERVKLPIVSVACVAVGLIDFNPSVQRFHLDRCKAYLDFAYELGAKNVLLVLGEYIWERQVIPPDEQWRPASNTSRRSATMARSWASRSRWSLEPFKLSLLNNVPNMVKFIDDVNNPAVKANIDVGHLQLAGTKPEELRALRGKAINIHISDGDGKVHGELPPGRGVVSVGPYLKEIAALGIDGAISIELEYSPEPDKIAEWVTEAYTATDRLMKQAGISRG